MDIGYLLVVIPLADYTCISEKQRDDGQIRYRVSNSLHKLAKPPANLQEV